MAKCRACGATGQPGDVLCRNCGTALVSEQNSIVRSPEGDIRSVRCEACESLSQPGDVLCRQCGTSLCQQEEVTETVAVQSGPVSAGSGERGVASAILETPAVLRAKDPNTPSKELSAIAVGPDRNAALAAVDNPSTPEWARRRASWRAYRFVGRDPEWRNIRDTEAGPVELATIPTRGFMFWFVDTTIAFFLTALLAGVPATAALLGVLSGGLAIGLPENVVVILAFIVYFSLIIAVYLAYFAVSYVKWGRTLGMRWASLRVIDQTTAANLTWGRAWLRSLILNVALVTPMQFVWWGLTANDMKQGPHDQAARSLVVKAPKGQAVLKVWQ